MTLAKSQLIAIGTIVYRVDTMDSLGINTTELKSVLDYLNQAMVEMKCDYRIGRIDAGGKPRWDFIKL
jgi:hypothetical protein